jgi:hypothetical protein
VTAQQPGPTEEQERADLDRFLARWLADVAEGQPEPSREPEEQTERAT